MTDSTDSIQNNEVTEEVKKLGQFPGIVETADALNVIGSESEQVKLSGSKASNQFRIGTYSSKNLAQDEIVIGKSSEKLPINITESDLKYPDVPGITINSFSITNNLETIPVSNDPIPEVESINENNSSEIPEPISLQVDVVPECMYTILQQRAQNVLKMISERKYLESIPPPKQESNISRPSSASSQNRCSTQSVEKTSNESTLDSISKASYHSSKDLNEEKSSINVDEHSSHKVVNLNVPEDIPGTISYDNLKQETVSQLLKANASNKGPEKSVPLSESHQSNISTEQCTTDYSTKSATCDNPQSEDLTRKPSLPENSNLVRQCSANPFECVSVKTTDEMGFDTINQVLHEQSTNNEMLKKLSEIIDPIELPIKLSKKGQLICHLFRQKLLLKLESTGNLDESSANIASLTALKFATWMEDILKEIDVRKKSATKENQGVLINDLIETKEENEQEESATKKVEMNEDESEDGSEVIKMQELTESELIQKYGSYLLRESYDLFEFIGPDSVPVEVRHITAVISKKVMIVKKKTSDTQWSNWVIEVGPEVSLDSVSGIEQQLELNEEEQKHLTEAEAGKRNIKKTDWDNWKPDIFKQTVTYCRIPLLKKQCMMTEADVGIEYPSYPAIYSQSTGDVAVLEDRLEESFANSQASKGDPSCGQDIL